VSRGCTGLRRETPEPQAADWGGVLRPITDWAGRLEVRQSFSGGRAGLGPEAVCLAGDRARAAGGSDGLTPPWGELGILFFPFFFLFAAGDPRVEARRRSLVLGQAGSHGASTLLN